MQYPIHRFILFFLSILSTTIPTAARPSIPGAPPTTPPTLPTSDLNYPQPKPPTSSNPEIANAPPLPKRRGGEGDNRIFQQRWLPSLTPKTANPLPKRRGGEGDNRRWLPSITPETSNPLPLRLHKRRGGEGDNRRWLPTSDSGRSATEIENFLTNPGGIVDNAREVLVIHDVSNGGSRGRERRKVEVENETIDPFNAERSIETTKEE